MEFFLKADLSLQMAGPHCLISDYDAL